MECLNVTVDNQVQGHVVYPGICPK